MRRPIFIVAAPRSGSTLLFETLAKAPEIWTVGGEAHEIFEYSPLLRPGAPSVVANRITAASATPDVAANIKRLIYAKLIDRDGRTIVDVAKPAEIRLLEKTPKNSLRIPFIDAIFPDALFIYLYREGRPNISSIIKAWESGSWVTYGRLPDWPGTWSLLLPPNWQTLKAKPLAEIAYFQWASANQHIIHDLSTMPTTKWTAIDYNRLIDNSQDEIKRLCEFCGVTFDNVINMRTKGRLPLSRYTHTAPKVDKWRQHEQQLRNIEGRIDDIEARIAEFLRRHPRQPGDAEQPFNAT